MADDPYKYFRIEARDLVEQLGKGALDLERGGSTAQIVPQMLRLAHTLKGAARVVKQREIAELAHAVEDALGPFRAGDVAVSHDSVSTVFRLLDAAGEGLKSLGASAPPAGVADAASAAAADRGARPAATPAAEEPARTLRADVAEIDGLLEGISEAHGQLGALRRGAGAIERVRHLAEVLAEQLASPRAAAAGGSPASAAAAARALSIAGELRRLCGSVEQSLGRGFEQVDRELRQVRQSAERLRLVPVGATFNVLERAARDAAQSLGLRVAFEAKGGDVRIDADVLGVVQSALVQMVRNAVAHGIEPEADRVAAGKPAEGRIAVEIERRGGRVAFSCRDDGRGVDLEAVRGAARARGLTAAESERLGSDDLVRLLLKGGISTSDTVTTVSGRGIGLDIVSNVAHRLGGDVTVKTAPGRGTTLEIAVPISLSSLDALIVEVEDRTAAIPLDAVRRIVRVEAADVAHTPAGDTILFDGKVIPFAPLARSLRVAGRAAEAPHAWSAVVVESGGACAALGVGRLVGTETIVLQPLPAAAPADPVVAGASLDAEGNPQLVLAPDALVAAAAGASDGVARPAPGARTPILVIDDSLTTRMLEQSILELAGYEVDLATSAEEGLAKAKLRRYGLYLVDVEMPGMDGFTFVATTQADSVLRDVPAVLVTSRNAPEDRQRGVDVGAKGYMVKSEFDQNELLDRIRKLVA